MIVDKSRPYKAIIHPAQEATMVTLVYTKPAKEIWIRLKHRVKCVPCNLIYM